MLNALEVQEWTCHGYRANTIPEDINCDSFVNIKDTVRLNNWFGWPNTN